MGFPCPVPQPTMARSPLDLQTRIFGDAFGSDVLAVTIFTADGDIMTEADVLLNLAWPWDIPDGPVPPDLPPFGAVVTHEFGRVLGLDHPDEHGQKVLALMNSRLSDYEVLQSDDYLGVQALYAEGPDRLPALDAPVLLNLSTRGMVGTGDDVLIAGFVVQGDGPATVVLRAIGQSLSISGVTNPLFDPKLSVYDASNNLLAENDDWIDGPDAETIAGYFLDPENSGAGAVYLVLDSGAYTVVMEGVASRGHDATGIGLVES